MRHLDQTNSFSGYHGTPCHSAAGSPWGIGRPAERVGDGETEGRGDAVIVAVAVAVGGVGDAVIVAVTVIVGEGSGVSVG